MKEATSELNITVIVVVIVAMLSFFFFSYLWPNIRAGFSSSAKCDEAICMCPGKDANGLCTATAGDPVNCTYKDKNGTEHSITCSWKG